MYLKDSSSFTGAINTDGQKGDVYVEIEDGSKWKLTADSYVSGLTAGTGAEIDLNGHKLYVDGKEYESGTSSEGTAFDITTGSGNSQSAPGGENGQMQAPPDGNGQGGPGGTPPEKPSGDNGSAPPEKPDN